MKVYSKGKVNLFQGNCMDLMASKPDNYYDLAVVDPEYGIGASEMTMGSGRHKFKKGKKWDSKPPDITYFNELFRISRNQIIWGGNYFADKLPITPHWLLWDKQNPNLSFAEGELAWVRVGKNLRIFKHYSALVEKGGKIHNTQKPVKLYAWILHNYAKPDFKVLDTHGGSMSSAIAAYYFGCEFDCIELDEDYYNDAVKRFKEQTMQAKTKFVSTKEEFKQEKLF